MLTTSEIKRFIEEDISSERKRLARIGQRYYDAEHDILNYRMFYYNADGILVEDKARSNAKISHPFFTENVDQCSAYLLSGSENPIQSETQGLQEILDVYFDDEFWSEFYDLITGTQISGFSYLYGYKNEDDRLAFQYADGAGVVEVRAKDTDDSCDYVIYWWTDRIEKGKKKIKRIRVHDKDQTWFYVWADGGSVEIDKEEPQNPKPNHVWTEPNGEKWGKGLGYIPFWRLDYNRKQTSALKPIKGLIDDYDLMECGLSNNLKDFDTPIHVVRGFDGDNLDELQQNLKTKKIIGVDEAGGLDVKTIDIPFEARKTKADEDEKNIYRFGMGFNSSMVGDGNVTNIVIRSRYTLLDLKAKKLAMRIKKFLKPIIKTVLAEINEVYNTDYQYSDVIVEFTPEIPSNESENAQLELVEAQRKNIEIGMIKSVETILGDEETLRAVCDILDIDFDDVKEVLDEKKEVQNLLDAQRTLGSVVAVDEQTTANNSAEVSE